MKNRVGRAFSRLEAILGRVLQRQEAAHEVLDVDHRQPHALKTPQNHLKSLEISLNPFPKDNPTARYVSSDLRIVYVKSVHLTEFNIEFPLGHVDSHDVYSDKELCPTNIDDHLI